MEIAGFVLAIFPVAVEGLRFYLRGLESIKRWWRYARAVRELLRALEMEKVKFEESCEELLYELVDAGHLDRLLQVPGGPEWQHADLQSALKERLGRGFGVFMTAIAEMKTSLETLTEKLDLEWKSGSARGRHSLFKEQWRRIRFSLMAEENKQMLRDMGKHNKNLGVLLGHTKRMAPLKVPKSSAYAGKYQCLRRDAESLYKAVRKGVTSNCRCLATHTACLKLEARYLFRYIPDPESGVSLHNPLFNVILSFDTDTLGTRKPPWIWRETCFEPVPNQRPQAMAVDIFTANKLTSLPTTEAIRNIGIIPLEGKGSRDETNTQFIIRGSIKRTTKTRVSFAPSALVYPATTQLIRPLEVVGKPAEQLEEPTMIEAGLCELITNTRDEDSCLGLLISEPGKQHRVRVKKFTQQSDSVNFVSLESLLSDRFDIDRKRSLVLALKLTSSVLQLHTTPWLNESWGKQDVKFLRQQKSEGDALIERSFVSKNIASLENESPQQSSESVVIPGIRNQSLFSLGVVLIELWFGRTLQSLHTWNNENENWQSSAAKDMVAAVQLLDDIYRQAGDWYGDAVRRCLYCDFDQRNTNLEENAMKDSVFRGVMLPLRDHLKALCGGQLDDETLS